MELSAVSYQPSAKSLFLKPFAESRTLSADSYRTKTLVFGWSPVNI
jgi:hypothetical protein